MYKSKSHRKSLDNLEIVCRRAGWIQSLRNGKNLGVAVSKWGGRVYDIQGNIRAELPPLFWVSDGSQASIFIHFFPTSSQCRIAMSSENPNPSENVPTPTAAKSASTASFLLRRLPLLFILALLGVAFVYREQLMAQYFYYTEEAAKAKVVEQLEPHPDRMAPTGAGA